MNEVFGKLGDKVWPIGDKMEITHEQWRTIGQVVTDYKAENESLRSKIEIYKKLIKSGDEVCEFYGDRENWRLSECWEYLEITKKDMELNLTKAVAAYGGKLAREKQSERAILKEGLK